MSGSTDRDLGDAAIGSALIRYVRAKGGNAPYRFSSDRNTTTTTDTSSPVLFIGTQTIGDAIGQLPNSAKPSASTAAIFVTGELKGAVGGSGGTIPDGTPLRFDVTAADSHGSAPRKIDEIFSSVTLVNSDVFKFAQSELDRMARRIGATANGCR